MGDSKAVLNGCQDHWTLQDRGAMPRLFRMTVCVHVRVLSPGAWVAFSYRSAHAPRPELGLEGDDGALYAWLLGVRHRFPRPLAPDRWQQVCLRRDVHGNSFSIHVRTFNDQPRSRVRLMRENLHIFVLFLFSFDFFSCINCRYLFIYVFIFCPPPIPY